MTPYSVNFIHSREGHHVLINHQPAAKSAKTPKRGAKVCFCLLITLHAQQEKTLSKRQLLGNSKKSKALFKNGVLFGRNKNIVCISHNMNNSMKKTRVQKFVNAVEILEKQGITKEQSLFAILNY